MKRKYFLFIYSLFAFELLAQIEPGARNIALGNSSYALADEVFSVFYNPAGISQLPWNEFSIYYSPSPFGLTELSNGNIAFNYNLSLFSLAFGVKTFGFELFRETSFSLAISKRFFEKFFFGISMDNNFLKIKNYGSSFTTSLNIGFIYFLYKNLKFGFASENITLSSYSGETNEIPTEISFALNYSPVIESNINLAITKELGFPVSLKFGAEYEVFRYFLLRFGFESEPKSYTIGSGIIYGIAEIDYTAFIHSVLPITHQISITIATDVIEKRNLVIRNFLFKNE